MNTIGTRGGIKKIVQRDKKGKHIYGCYDVVPLPLLIVYYFISDLVVKCMLGLWL